MSGCDLSKLPPSQPLVHDLPRLRAALEDARGNITRAAKALKVQKSYLMGLVRKHGLNTWCRNLREASGVPHTGRPPSIPRLT